MKPRELTIRGLILGALLTTIFTAAPVENMISHFAIDVTVARFCASCG